MNNEHLKIKQKYHDQVLRDLTRFRRFPIEQFVGKEASHGWVIDVACGDGDAGIGLVRGMHDRGCTGGYVGIDILPFSDFLVSDFTKLLQSGLLPEDWIDFYDHHRDLIQLRYGTAWDATKPSLWEQLEKEVGSIAMLLMRHPDVRGEPEVFTEIFTNMIGYASHKHVPMIITTSNSVSQRKIYDRLTESMKQNGCMLHERTEARDWRGLYGENLTYSSPEGVWNLTTYDTEAFAVPLGKKLIDGYNVNYKLDAFTLAQ